MGILDEEEDYDKEFMGEEKVKFNLIWGSN